jgi:hypothetical protein
MSNAPQNQKSTSQNTPSSNQSNASKNTTIPLKDEHKAQSKDGSCSTSSSATDTKSSCGTK